MILFLKQYVKLTSLTSLVIITSESGSFKTYHSDDKMWSSNIMQSVCFLTAKSIVQVFNAIIMVFLFFLFNMLEVLGILFLMDWLAYDTSVQ